MTPTPDIKNDIHLTHIEDDMWQVLVITHVFINDIEVGQTTWCNTVSVKPKNTLKHQVCHSGGPYGM